MGIKVRRKPLRIRRKKRILKAPVFWLFLLFFAVFVCAVYFLVFFDKVQIKTIIISGNEKVSVTGIEEIVSGGLNKKILFFNSKSIFLINTGKISRDVSGAYPEIESVSVKKNFFDALTVNITERTPAVIFCKDDRSFNNCYYLDKNGVAFEKAENEFGQYLIVRPASAEASADRQNKPENEISIGQTIADGNMVGLLAAARNDLENSYQVILNEARIVSADRLNITTGEGWEVYFNLNKDIGLQITKLKLLLDKELLKEKRAGLQYIDLRFEKAYYK